MICPRCNGRGGSRSLKTVNGGYQEEDCSVWYECSTCKGMCYVIFLGRVWKKKEWCSCFRCKGLGSVITRAPIRKYRNGAPAEWENVTQKCSQCKGEKGWYVGGYWVNSYKPDYATVPVDGNSSSGCLIIILCSSLALAIVGTCIVY